MEAVGKQDHKETKFALPQSTSLQGLPRFVSPGQPVPMSELKMEHRLTSVMGTKNNLGFSLCTAHTQGIVKFMPMSVMSVCANRLSHRQETSVKRFASGLLITGFCFRKHTDSKLLKWTMLLKEKSEKERSKQEPPSEETTSLPLTFLLWRTPPPPADHLGLGLSFLLFGQLIPLHGSNHLIGSWCKCRREFTKGSLFWP